MFPVRFFSQIRRHAALLGAYFTQYAKVRMSYRADFFISLATSVTATVFSLGFVYVLFQRVPRLADWRWEEVMFLYGFSLIPFGLFNVLSMNLYEFGNTYIIEGKFDRVLLRPISALFQVIFETLNARGVPLEPSDLIRNFVFMYATRRGEDIEALYAKHWQEFDTAPALPGRSETKRFWKDMERQGRLRRSRLDLFLFHFVTSRAERELTIGHLFQEFRDWWVSVPERATDAELGAMRKSSDVFKSLLLPDKESRFGVFASRLRVLDTTTVYPVMLFIGERRSGMSADDFNGLLEDLESYLIRRMVCSLTTKNYNKVFLGVLKALRKAETISRAALRAELLGLEGESSVWPNDDLFRRHWLSDPVYNTLGSARTQMVLTALDLALDTPRQERIRIDEWLSVEHVMPQSASLSDWPYPPTAGAGEGPIDERLLRRAALLHSFGNLTLLTQSLNSAVSNGPFSAKRAEIAQQSRLRLNSYFQRFGDTDTWDEDALVRRGEGLFTLACRVWPRPADGFAADNA